MRRRESIKQSTLNDRYPPPRRERNQGRNERTTNVVVIDGLSPAARERCQFVEKS